MKNETLRFGAIRPSVVQGARSIVGLMLVALAFAPANACGGGSDGQGAGGGAGAGGSAGSGGLGGSAGSAGVGGSAGGAGLGGDAGTSGSGGAAGSPDAGPTTESVCTDWANIFCDTLQQCASRLYLAYATPADCVARYVSDCESDFALNSKRTVEWQAACNAAYDAAGCPALFDSPSECKSPAGDKAAGSPCFKTTECVAGASCVIQSGATSSCGVCKMDAHVGDACGNGVVCADGLRCDGTCYEPSQLGEPCYSGALCAFPLVCGSSGDPCHAARQLGASCGPTVDDCDQYDGLHCNSGSHTCENILVASNAGDHCGFNSSNGMLTVCAGDLYCSGNNYSIDLCNPKSAEGQGCQLQSDGTDRCPAGLFCSAGKCVKADAVVCQ